MAAGDKPERVRFDYWWELVLLGIIGIELLLLGIYFPKLLRPAEFIGITINFMEMGIVAMAMAYVIISKNIDISVASLMALVSVVVASAVKSGLPLWLALLLGLLAGAVGGFLNGVLITKMNIPSLVVTLGTMSLYRGAAYVVTGDQTYSKYPEVFSVIGRGSVFGLPVPLVVFLVIFLVSGFILHYTTFGRKVYAIGNNRTAALFSGIKVDRVVIAIFTLIGFYSAIAAIIMTSRNNSTRGNMAQGLELDIITSTVLGGVSMDGGKGKLLGVFLAVFVIGIVRNGMYAKNISPEMMKIVIGMLLILSLLIPKVGKRIREGRGARAAA